VELNLLQDQSFLLVSACLLGLPTRYDGRPTLILPELLEMAAKGRLIPICPEVAGGLPVPRPPAECSEGDGKAVLEGRARIRNIHGEDVTDAFLVGAHHTLDTAQRLGITQALLKACSPSCGSRQIHDGTFQGRLVPGQGVTAALLRHHGITVFSEQNWLDGGNLASRP
jgi:uncharacterized protein YbbK (DUF523 family)